MNDNTEPFVSNSVLNIVLQVAEELGADLSFILQQSGIKRKQLEQEKQFLPLSSVKSLFFNATKAVNINEQEFAFLCGQHANLNNYGPVGMAAMSEKTFGDAINIASEFFGIISPVFAVQRSKSEQFITLTLLSKINFKEYDFQLIIFFLAGTCKEMVKTLLGTRRLPMLNQVNITLPIPDSNLLKKDRDLRNFSMQFNANVCSLTIPVQLADLPLALSNRFAADKFKQECIDIKEGNLSSIASYLRNRISEAEYKFPSLDDIAEELKTSSRSLNRALAEENTSYRSISIHIKMHRAAELLKTSHLSVAEISDKLGYSDSSNFSKAFKTFYGTTPKKYLEKNI